MWEDITKQIETAKLRILEKQRCKGQLERCIADIREEEHRNEAYKLILLQDEELANRLQGMSLTHLFHTVIGNLEEHEAVAAQKIVHAKMQLDASNSALQYLRTEKQRFEDSVSALRFAEEDYQKLLQTKADRLVTSPGPLGEKLAELAETVADLRLEQREIDEARSAARTALYALQDCLAALEKAGNWGRLDMLGGGMIVTAIKRGHMDDANSAAVHAQNALRSLDRELKDVRMALEAPLNGGGFLSFSDYFFDGLIVDWMVQDQIRQSEASVSMQKDKVEAVLNTLERAMENVARRQEGLNEERTRLIESAE